jgi:hypothetical protein
LDIKRRGDYQPHARNGSQHVDSIVSKDKSNRRVGCWESHIFEEGGAVVENDVDASPLLEKLKYD